MSSTDLMDDDLEALQARINQRRMLKASGQSEGAPMTDLLLGLTGGLASGLYGKGAPDYASQALKARSEAEAARLKALDDGTDIKPLVDLAKVKLADKKSAAERAAADARLDKTLEAHKANTQAQITAANERTDKLISARTEKAPKPPKGMKFETDPETGELKAVPENPAKYAYDQLPPDNQEIIKDLSKKNASKVAISNQIDAVVKVLDDPKIDADQKLMQARQMIKTLNSVEGADAVGAEEAKRLAGLLEYQVFNFTQPGPFFGRAPIGEFSEQAKLTSANIRNAINANNGVVSQLRSGKPLDVPEQDLSKFATQPKSYLPEFLSGKNANASTPSKPPRPGMIKVSNGKEAHWIQPSDLKDAMSDGFQVTQ